MRPFWRKRIKFPVEGHAEIVEAWKRNPGRNDGNCKMTLLLDDVPGVEPQRIRHHEPLMFAHRWPEVGMRVAVTVDLHHPDRCEVHWESVFGEVRGGALGVGAEMLATAAGVELDLSKGPESDEPKGEVADDYVARIADLNAQYAAGTITYEEMADGVRRTLGG